MTRNERRDLFAAAALTGILAGDEDDVLAPRQAAELAWDYAQWMLVISDDDQMKGQEDI